MQLLQRIHDGKKSVGRQGGQRKNGHPYRNVLGRLGQLANQFAPRPRVDRVHDRRKRNARYYHQQVGQRQRQNIPIKKIHNQTGRKTTPTPLHLRVRNISHSAMLQKNNHERPVPDDAHDENQKKQNGHEVGLGPLVVGHEVGHRGVRELGRVDLDGKIDDCSPVAAVQKGLERVACVAHAVPSVFAHSICAKRSGKIKKLEFDLERVALKRILSKSREEINQFAIFPRRKQLRE